MALAVAFGCAAIALEMASELSSHSANFHRRLLVLNSRIVRLRTEAADAERRLMAMRAEQLNRAQLNRVLSAPDAMVLRLAPKAGGNARGLVAISRKTGQAIIEVAGLSPMQGHGVMWWVLAQAPPAKAAELTTGADGREALAVKLPPRGVRVVGAIITLDSGKSSDKPDGPIILQGALPHPQVLS
jgi:hypothetical protein